VSRASLTPESARISRLHRSATAAHITISPAQLTLPPNGRAPLQASLVDPTGNPVTGLPIHWSSSDSNIARVDESTGVVTAGTPGTARIIASSDRLNATVDVVVERPAVVASAPQSRATHVDSTRALVVARATDAQVRSAAEQCARAVQSRDATTLIALAHAATPDERRVLDQFVTLLRDDQAKLNIAAPVFGASRVSDTAAASEFSVRLTWRSSFGRQRESAVNFESVLESGADGWRLARCRPVGTPRLQ
jgi:hypothetical protein